MTNNEAFDRALDILIDEAVSIVNDKDGNALTADMDIEFSDEHEAKMKRLFKKKRNERLKSRALIYGKRAACICLVALIVAGTSVFSVEAWRARFLNFFFDEDAPNSEYNFNELGGTYYSDDYISLEYIPWGFEVAKSNETENIIQLLFKNEELYLMVSVSSTGGQGSIDTEDATVSRIGIDNCEAILVEKDDVNQILWQNGDHEFYIAGNISSNEIIKIAKNLKKI